jgi:hypothetical protein
MVGASTIADLQDYGISVLGLSLIFIPLGQVLSRALNLFGYREQSQGTKWAISLLLGLACAPILIFWLARFGGWPAVAVFGVLISLAYLGQFLLSGGPRNTDNSGTVSLSIASVVWIVISGMSLVDIEWNGQLYRRISHYDHSKHACVTDAVIREGVWPSNPSYAPGEKKPLYYYYFWHMLGGTVGKLFEEVGVPGVTPRGLAMAGVAWAGLAFIAAIHLFISLGLMAHVPKNYGTGFALLLVTGIDILAQIIQSWWQSLDSGVFHMHPNLNSWNGDIVTTLSAILVWVPHHAGALCAVLFGWVCLRRSVADKSYIPALLAGFAFSSSIGMSVWIAIVAAASLAVWFGISLLKQWWDEVRVLLCAGVVTAILILPFVVELKAAQIESRPAIAFQIRPFIYLAQFGLYDGLSMNQFTLVSLLLLPFNYIIEMGFYSITGFLYWRYRRNGAMTREDGFYLTMFLMSFVVCGFFRSAIRNDDLGMRGTSQSQFLLLLWAIPVVSGLISPSQEWHSRLNSWRTPLIFTGFCGLLSTGFFLVMHRTHTPGESGAPGLALRQGYDWIHQNTPRNAIVQHSWKEYHPLRSGYFLQYEGTHEMFHLLYGHRQCVISDEMHGMLFGIPKKDFDVHAKSINRLFELPLTREELQRECQRYQIDFLVVKRFDPVFDATESGFSTMVPVFQNDEVKIYDLRGEHSQHDRK